MEAGTLDRVDQRSLDRLGDEIAELSAHLDAATARLLDLIREFDTGGGWNTGFRCCADWLSWRVGLNRGAARERVRVARALGSLPLLAAALGQGTLSYAKVRALTRVATPETEPQLLGIGKSGTAAHVEQIVRAWRRVDRLAEAREAAAQHAGRSLHVHRSEDGMVIIRGRVAPEVGALLLQALAAARETLHQRGRDQETHRPSTIRWWSTSMRRRSPTPSNPVSPLSMVATAFPRKRAAGSRATRAEWSCSTVGMATSWRLAPAPVRSRPPFAAFSTIEIS